MAPKNELEISDEKLMARFKRGDASAMDELVSRYEKPLIGFLWRMQGNAADIQDIFQNVWLRVIAKSRDFRQDRFKGWLFKIAHNLVIDTARKNKKWISLDEPLPGTGEHHETLANTLASEDPDPASRVNRTDIRHAIDEALAELPKEQREVLIMRMETELTFREIAGILDIPLNTCLARMQYALTKMRAMLRTCHPETEDHHEL